MSKPNPGRRQRQKLSRPTPDSNPVGSEAGDTNISRVKRLFVDRASKALDTPATTSILNIVVTVLGGLTVGFFAGLLVVFSADWPKPWPLVFIWGVPALLSVVRQHLLVRFAAPNITDIAANVMARKVSAPDARRLSRSKRTATDNIVRGGIQSTAITVIITCCGSGTYLLANANDVSPAWLADTWGTIRFVVVMGGVASLIEALKVPSTIKALWRMPWRE